MVICKTKAYCDLSDLDRNLKRFLKVESCGAEASSPNVLTEDDRVALEKVQESLSRVERRYQIGVSWKEDRPTLPFNCKMGLCRLRNTEKNLQKNDFVSEEYGNTIKAYVEKGHLRKNHSKEKPPSDVWYLPHFTSLPTKNTPKSSQQTDLFESV